MAAEQGGIPVPRMLLYSLLMLLLFGCPKQGTGDPPTLAETAAISVRIDDLAEGIPINPAVFGVHVGAGGQGAFSPSTSFARPYGLASRGIRSIRSYGCDADVNHWRTLVGPIGKRSRFAHSNACFVNDVRRLFDASPVFPLHHEWGVDEVFEFATSGGAEMVGTVNFGTGSAREAANFVEYANAPSPDPACDGADGAMPGGWRPDQYDGGDRAPRGYFACLRHFFGREKPYGVRYWEVGNEIAGHSSPTWTSDTQLYYRGGSADIEPGYVTRDPLGYNWSGKSRQTTCAPNERFYVMFPPIDPVGGKLSVELFENHRSCGVGGAAEVCKWTPVARAVGRWKEVSSLANAGPEDRVFEVDRERGAIRFGDGVHGQSPPCVTDPGRGYEVVVGSYTSGPHDGFVAYEHAMKEVDPTIRVGSGHPWPPAEPKLLASLDFMVMHPYMVASGPDTGSQRGMGEAPDLKLFRPAVMAWAESTVGPTVRRYRELFGRDIELAWTEWNLQHAFTGVPPTPEYTTSLDVGLFVADMLRSAIVHRVAVASYFGLGATPHRPSDPRAQGYGLVTFGSWEGVGAERRLSVVPQPAGLVFQMFGDDFGSEALDTRVVGAPHFSACWPTCNESWGEGSAYPAGPRDYPVLEALGSRRPDGRIAILLLNKSLARPLEVQIELASGPLPAGPARWVLLNSRDPAAHPSKVTNTRSNPEAVALTARELSSNGSLRVAVAAHSVGMLVLPGPSGARGSN